MSQALYRRFRPETFADVIGQEHVTDPLQQALRHDRTTHAYLFSGPRGCGKTTSARILARCLNCAQGPTPEPCGRCDSCVALARNGPGHIDVIEIDAASHGGVDDARDLRDKAFFAPAASRYKIYIVDEAHMVTTQGFNALLKIVEEPPPHLKFVFATTEPDKVIGTIRSRTHHYPFRLVPPGRLQDYLAEVCRREGVEVEKGVLALVVRAGRGSVRDALSVLDQLIAGAGDIGVTYRLAIALLGFTDAALLDDVIEAFAVSDGAALFSVVDRVIEGGHDPKRFAEDLLERLRDLILLDAVPDAATSLLGDLPADQVERMRLQATRFGAAELSRAADLVSVGLTEMRGATAPRLQLELICARLLLPGAHDDERSVSARLDRIERRLSVGGMPEPSAVPVGTGVPRRAGTAASDPGAAGSLASDAPHRPRDASQEADLSSPPRGATAPPTSHPPVPTSPTSHPTMSPSQPAQAERTGDESAPGPAGLDVGGVRAMWTEVLGRLASLKRASWTLVSQNATVADVEPRRLTLAFSSAGLRDTFARGAHPELVRQALIDVLGLDVAVEAIVDPSAGEGPARSGPRHAPGDVGRGASAGARRPDVTRPGGGRGGSGPRGSGRGGGGAGGGGRRGGAAPEGSAGGGWRPDDEPPPDDDPGYDPAYDVTSDAAGPAAPPIPPAVPIGVPAGEPTGTGDGTPAPAEGAAAPALERGATSAGAERGATSAGAGRGGTSAGDAGSAVAPADAETAGWPRTATPPAGAAAPSSDPNSPPARGRRLPAERGEPAVRRAATRAPDPVGQRSPRIPRAAAGAPYVAPEEDVPSDDDDDLDERGMSSRELLARELGAKVIDEYDD